MLGLIFSEMGKKLGLYSEKYRVKSVGKWLSEISILYDLEVFQSEYGYPI